jgi:oligopeptide transport system permease protein
MARVVRGQTLSIKSREFIEAARAIGVPTRRIILRTSCRTCSAWW